MFHAHGLQVKLNIWYPTNLTLSAVDTTLNSVLPVNAAPVSSSCMDTYQSTLLKLTADWSNGGVNATDRLAAVDMTDLVAFQSSDSNVVQVAGALAKVCCSLRSCFIGAAACCCVALLSSCCQCP
jgi:hypothetical protein